RVRAGRVRVPAGPAGQRPGAGPADEPGARGAAAAGPRLRVQGDREGAVHLDQDGRDARVERAAQAPDVQPVRVVPLGGRPPPRVTGYYDTEAVRYDATRGGRPSARAAAAALAGLLGPPSGPVLDLAGGTGSVAAELTAAGHRVLVLDGSAGML